MLFGEFGQRNFKIWYMIPVKKTKFLKNFGPQNASIWQVLSRKRQLTARLMEKLVSLAKGIIFTNIGVANGYILTPLSEI